MGDWSVVSREIVTEEIINEFVGGAVPYIYTVEFDDTGETRKVIAYNEDELGEKIANGEFYD